MSPTDKRKAKYGDDNQAENLILAKEESAEKISSEEELCNEDDPNYFSDPEF